MMQKVGDPVWAVVFHSTVTSRGAKHVPRGRCRQTVHLLLGLPGLRVMLKPKHGDCCIFCSYGDVACLPGPSRSWKLSLLTELTPYCCTGAIIGP